MKRFITISLLMALAVRAYPCIGIGTDNYYLFCVCDKKEFRERVNKITLDNWKTYMGKEEYYWFDADEVISYAQGKQDALMVSYVRNLKKYLDCSDEVVAEQWDYPTKDQLQQRRQTLQNVRAYASTKLRSRLRSQHALLYMRCNMLLGDHAKNVTFWETIANGYIESVYKDMMQNIYAGALLKTGRAAEAGRLFAEMGDWSSLMTQYYKQRSFVAIRDEYQRDANSAVLPFLLQDFVNNCQEAIDAVSGGETQGKLFIRDIQREEALQMKRFCAQVVLEDKTDVPALWKAAEAWLEYFYGDRKKALTYAEVATQLEGTERMADVAHVIYSYIKADVEAVSPAFDSWLAGELTWLKKKSDDGGWYSYYGNALHRLVNKVAAQKYAAAGQPTTSAALYALVNQSAAQAFVDTMSVEDVQKYMVYLKTPAATPLERLLKPGLQLDDNYLNDLVGTKYLRVCRWEEAIQWLSKVPLTFYNEKGYAVYAANRRYTVEPWITRQWLKSDMEWNHDPIHLRANPKLTFAREVQRMEGELNVLGGVQRQQRCYDLAVRYAQAHFSGDCWFLMHDGKSLYDVQKPNETDLAAKAMDYLQQAAKTTDVLLKEKALFAMTYGVFYKQWWFESVWNSDKRDYDLKENPASPQFKAFTTLLRFERSRSNGPSAYVSRCDAYDTFANRH
jgi:hypothetical protein